MLIPEYSPARRSRIRGALLRWYDANKRDLPWRKTKDPYAIWISETMLQQTQVVTVLPYYQRFMQRFPTPEALDRATLRSVLSAWTGLGYYRRAENLKKAARMVVRHHNGQLPSDYQMLLALPGVGQYTAGALMSIAFDKPYAAVDGNARRVYCRLFGLSSVAESDAAAQLMISRRPGDYTQAVMELGATLCTPSQPLCSRCPIAHWCEARRTGCYDRLQRPRAKLKPLDWPLVFVESNGSVLLHRRPQRGLLAGLWELPDPATLTDRCDGLGAILKDLPPITVIRHTITDHRITAPLYALRNNIEAAGPSWAWVPPSELSSYPLSSLSTKAIQKARKFLEV